MRLALLLFGLHFQPVYKNRHIDFSRTLRHFRILKKFCESLFNRVDVYLATNTSQFLEEYKQATGAVSTTTTNLGRNGKIVEGLKKIRESNKDYTHILITRPDLRWNQPFEKRMFDFEKLNLVSELENTNAVCDNLYLFPIRYLERFIQLYSTVVNDCSGHFLYPEFRNSFDIHLIRNEKTGPKKMTFYTIHRVSPDEGNRGGDRKLYSKRRRRLKFSRFSR